MKSPSRQRATWLGIIVFAFVITAEVGSLQYDRSISRRAEIRLRRAEKELERIRLQQPAPTEASARALGADVGELRRTVGTLEAAFAGSELIAEQTAPTGPTDLFFAIRTRVEALRAQARELNIGLAREAAAFGFSAYAREGPDPARTVAVRRQMEVAGDLVSALLAARPRMIVAVQREAPLTEVEQKARHSPAKRAEHAGTSTVRISARESGDYFVIDPRSSVFAPGAIDTMAFRLMFVGDTRALREFLRGISPAGSPLVVRSIEVETAASEPGGSARPKGEPPPSIMLRENAVAPKPVVAPPNLGSKFTVVVEYLQLVQSAVVDEPKTKT